jgi:antitoxin component YwqK of YwqJK toxin-antitoxin module
MITKIKHTKHLLKFVFQTTAIIFFVACNSSNDNKEGADKKQPVVEQHLSKEDSLLILKKQFYESIKSPNHYDSLEKRQGNWTILFDANWKSTNDIKEFAYYRTITYKNGIPLGKVIDHYLNGNKYREGSIKSDTLNDIIVGKSLWYGTDGKIKQQNLYINGIKTGEEIDFNSNGDIVAKRHYLNGTHHGQLINFYDNGNIKSQYNYYKGTLHGQQIEYSEGKKILSKENYTNGNLSGHYAKYYENGKPEQAGNYYKGKKIGSWYYYDHDGDYKKTQFMQARVGAICNDGWESSATGRGACSHHGGVNYWLVQTEEIVMAGTGKHRLTNGY